ncbi:MAG TPA: hypothetical protein VLG16_04715 [Candidatus Saccharimonadales bacterium]|nr:hypothetical protein [Candidatus Saccharimonadales bacterium]
MEFLPQTPVKETIESPNASLIDHVTNPDVSLAELLSEARLEGLSPEERLGLIERATVGDYEAAVDAIHYKVAPEHSHEPYTGAMWLESAPGEIVAYTAQPEDWAGIMTYALEKAKQVARKYRTEGGSIENALERCGNLGAFGVVLTHKYENGNGRTARSLGALIHYGFNNNDPDSASYLATVSANRPEKGTKGIRINSYVPMGKWADGNANKDPFAFLDAVAALDTPLDGGSYDGIKTGAFTATRQAR